MKRGPDKKPRELNPKALANLKSTALPGHRSISVRIYATEIVARWFERLLPPERGRIVTKLLPRDP